MASSLRSGLLCCLVVTIVMFFAYSMMLANRTSSRVKRRSSIVSFQQVQQRGEEDDTSTANSELKRFESLSIPSNELSGEEEKTAEKWTAKVSSLESVNWDETEGRCSDTSDTCVVTFRLPPQPVWNAERVIDGVRGVLEGAHPITGKIDSGFVCSLANIEVKEDHWVTKIEGVIDQFPDPVNPGAFYEVVHHLDTFFCEAGVQTTKEFDLDDQYTCGRDLFMERSIPNDFPDAVKEAYGKMYTSSSQPTCIFGPVHDKGATVFELPSDLGFKIGPSTLRAREIALQVHYLVPPDFDTKYSPVWDTSGYRLTLKRVRVQQQQQQQQQQQSPYQEEAEEGKITALGILTLNDYGLNYPQGVRNYTHVYTVDAETLVSFCRGDFEEFGNIQPVAVHLHAHSTTTALWVDHLNEEGEKVGEYGRIEAYQAHSEDQNYFLLPEKDRERPLVPGDSLRIQCVVDASDAPHDIPYGVSLNTEMCAIVVIYKNHNPESESNYKNSNMITYCSDLTQCGITVD